eukprot:CAMPEP_0202395168 /NCGR_PEP_ID=MMETSP1127-20130417/93828_1 /ASSEMBLY_ACC=CAM_ASM_000462 /TAXON_ID=3047 /ORGANISM="Dunaliella tertiolecta, Strain CCMP1320" /LENGTH=116 /DNA_ID=CAMNT_0048997853 /DNA_START=933 /DNA_END=1283 /DNA_ORIENTATION=-
MKHFWRTLHGPEHIVFVLCEARETRHGQHHHVLVVQAKEAPLPQFSHREHLLLLIYCQDDLELAEGKFAMLRLCAYGCLQQVATKQAHTLQALAAGHLVGQQPLDYLPQIRGEHLH